MNIDDPRLTAYALDELDEAERAAIADEVAASPEAQREIQETQTMARLLRKEFATELSNEAPLRANLSDIRDDPWFWSIARPLAIAAVIAVFAVIGLAIFGSYKLDQNEIVQASRHPTNLPLAAPSAVEAEMAQTATPMIALQQPAAQPEFGEERSQEGDIRTQNRKFNTADYGHLIENPFLAALDNPLSTFSIDVDTASYSIVRRFIYNGTLPSTSGAHKEAILSALDNLQAGGSTNGAEGIQLAYKIAADNFIKGGVNRVILATDGDFNVGVTSQGELIRLIEEKAKSGVFLSVLGVGDDNLKDSTMQKLADQGNGNYAYLDSLDEARKVLVQQMNRTLVTIAKDVKIQVEFNPARVASYRLIGYEKRMLRKEDFNNDKVDAGEIGAGHTVTALYEIVPAGTGATDPAANVPAVDPLKYQSPNPNSVGTTYIDSKRSEETLTVKLRYKKPDGDTSELTERAFTDNGSKFENAPPDLKFAAAVAEFGMILRDSAHKGNGTLGAVIEWAQEGKGRDAAGYRAGFIEMARKAQTLKPREG